MTHSRRAWPGKVLDDREQPSAHQQPAMTTVCCQARWGGIFWQRVVEHGLVTALPPRWRQALLYNMLDDAVLSSTLFDDVLCPGLCPCALGASLSGVVRDHHRLWLATQLAYIDFLDEQIEALSGSIVEGMRHCCQPARMQPALMWNGTLSIPSRRGNTSPVSSSCAPMKQM